MAAEHAKAAFVHLVGSVPLETPPQVFELVASTIGRSVRSVPDGEVGERKSFVQWQRIHIPANVRKPMFEGTPAEGRPPVSLTLDDIKPLRYDDAAISSYKTFKQMRDSGSFAPTTRFQVCLPTPNSVVRSLVDTAYCAQVEPLYETRLIEALHKIQAEIPPKDLTIQWDMPIEMAMLELERGNLTEPFFLDFFQPYFNPVRQGIMDRFKRLASHVHPDALMGYHMCYGNYKQKHWLEPKNVDLLVSVANELAAEVAPIHSIDFFHMPVPKDRADVEYLQPLKDAKFGPATLVLGLLHGFDLDGTRTRIQTAKQVWGKPFGITTECGMTNKPHEYLGSVQGISAAVVEG